MIPKRIIVSAGIIFAVLAAACGGAAKTSHPAGGSAKTTVSIEQVQGVGKVYTDANGMALYTPEQEANGAIRCTASCTSIWIPLDAPATGSPTEAPGVRGTLGVIDRPDGTKQVTLDGAPLYRFYQDSRAGTANGNGIQDSFDGTSFTWHVASVDGTSGGMQGSTNTGNNHYGY